MKSAKVLLNQSFTVRHSREKSRLRVLDYSL
jgi:hypothetical protein